jgi:predicted Zn-dependent protease
MYLQVVPGDRTEAQLISEIEDGMYIAMAGLTPDGASGEISATVDFGFRIIDGELAYPVKTAMIGSDVFTMLGNLAAVSSDYREEPGLIAPSLCFRDIQVAGAQ